MGSSALAQESSESQLSEAQRLICSLPPLRDKCSCSAPRPVCNDCLFPPLGVHRIVVPSCKERALELGDQGQSTFQSDTESLGLTVLLGPQELNTCLSMCHRPILPHSCLSWLTGTGSSMWIACSCK